MDGHERKRETNTNKRKRKEMTQQIKEMKEQEMEGFFMFFL